MQLSRPFSRISRIICTAALAVSLVGGTGCGRTKPASPTQAPEPAATGATAGAVNQADKQAAGSAQIHARQPRLANRQRRSRGAALKRPGAVDVLVRARGPAFDATTLDVALTPLISALRATSDVTAVWTQADAGEVRMVVRFGTNRTAAQAERVVLRSWQGRSMPQLATPVIAAIQPGQRAAAAMTVIANAGRRAATALLAKQINPATRALPPAARVWTAGAVRSYRVVQWMPPYLARFGVGIAAAQRRLLSALHGADSDLDALLRTTPAPTAKRPGTHLNDLCVTVTGEGEPIQRVFTGKREIVSTIVEAGGADEISALGTLLTRDIVHKNLRALAKNTEHFYHALAVMQRFRLIPKAGADRTSMATFRAQLGALGKAPIFHDAFTLAGIDGVPAALQTHTLDGLRWTVWVAVGAGLREEQIYQTLDEIFPTWQVVPVAAEHDTALGWLTDAETTTAAYFSSHDSALLGSSTATLARDLATERRIGARRSGPHLARTNMPYAITRRDAARKARVHAEDLALATQLKNEMIYVGEAKQVPVWAGLPTGVMSTRQSELPLASAEGLVPWQRVLQLPDAAKDTPRLRLDGMPTLWYGANPRQHTATEFGTAFWMAVEQRVEPSRRLEVRSLLMGQRPLSRALRAP